MLHVIFPLEFDVRLRSLGDRVLKIYIFTVKRMGPFSQFSQFFKCYDTIINLWSFVSFLFRSGPTKEYMDSE